MRSEFNQVGSSPFHLELQPSVLPTMSLAVPQQQGAVRTYRNGAVDGCVAWTFLYTHLWSTLHSLHIRPTTLPIFLLKDTLVGDVVHGVCQPVAVGYHAAGDPGRSPSLGASETIGQTFIEATYLTRSYFNPSPAFQHPYRDVEVLSHEISEWENDPFIQNHVQPYGYTYTGFNAPRVCSNYFETGDPVIQYATELPGNTYFQSSPGNDGTWTIEDEVFLPWFARQSQNLTSEPEPSTGIGRYTFFGDLNPDPQFHTPATAC
jgi:hypothetical protein